MTSVERVKAICKERKIPLSRIEAALGFANGYIGQLKKGTFPDDRLVLISEYLGVPVSALLGKEKSEAPKGAPDNAALKFALFGDTEGISDEDLEDVKRYAAFVRERKREQKKDGTP